MPDQKKNRWAAIDIGSNAIRMIVADYTPLGFKTIKKYRIPIRLGADVFSDGKISPSNFKASARAFERFHQVTDELGVTRLRAVGTSALREAKNKNSFIEHMRTKTDTRIEVIDGVEEARLIHEAIRQEVDLENHRCLLVDIGGGSVELTVSQKGMMIATSSFPFGTVRTLNLLKKRSLSEEGINLVIGEYVRPIADFLHQYATDRLEFAVGTGGNLEALGRLKSQLLKKSSRTSLNQEELSLIIAKLKRMSIKDRIEKLDMRSDRADVIIPAAMVIQAVLRQANINRLVIPHVGLRDGILWSFARRS